MAVNISVVSGNLTRDAELKQVGDLSILEFSIASNRKFKDKEEVLFLDCTVFGARANSLASLLTKGKQILVQGLLRQETWEKDGQKRSKIGLIVDSVEFLGARESAAPTQNTEVKSDVTESVPF